MASLRVNVQTPGIDARDFVAIGDSSNDIEMIKAA
jgi:hydroxymethylpyrimidine pyrophosphatase-like HAD family hydrolase